LGGKKILGELHRNAPHGCGPGPTPLYVPSVLRTTKCFLHQEFRCNEYILFEQEREKSQRTEELARVCLTAPDAMHTASAWRAMLARHGGITTAYFTATPVGNWYDFVFI